MSTLDGLVMQYTSGRRKRRVANATTTRTTTSTLLGFSEVFGNRPLERLSVRDIERWQESRSYLRKSTLRNQTSTVRVFCRWLHREGHIPRDVTDEIPKVVAARSQPRALSRAEVDAVLAVAPDARARAICWLLLGCGLRCCEVARAQLGDWDRRAGGIVARGKGDKERWVPLLGPAVDAIDAYLAEHPAGASGPLIRGYNDPWSPLKAKTISALVSQWFWDAGVKRTAHDGKSAHAFRHTAATDTLDEGGDLREVQELLGHEHLSTTSRYIGRISLTRLVDTQRARLARYGVAVDVEDPAA